MFPPVFLDVECRGRVELAAVPVAAVLHGAALVILGPVLEVQLVRLGPQAALMSDKKNEGYYLGRGQYGLNLLYLGTDLQRRRHKWLKFLPFNPL